MKKSVEPREKESVVSFYSETKYTVPAAAAGATASTTIAYNM